MESGLVAQFLNDFEDLKERRIDSAALFMQGDNKTLEDLLADLANICTLLYVARRTATIPQGFKSDSE